MRFISMMAAATLALAASSSTAETATYQYDALGRLIGSTLDHGSVTSTTIGYDPAGNRSSYQVQLSGGSQAQMAMTAHSAAATPSTPSTTIKQTFKTAVIAPALSKFKKPTH